MTIEALAPATGVPSVTAVQMAEVDRRTIEDLGVPLESLMENAAHRIAAATRLLLGGVHGKRIAALSGTGNNGGDALAALRHLRSWGAAVEAYVVVPRERLHALTGRQYDVLVRLGIPTHLTPALAPSELAARLGRADALLDGLLGYSVRGAPHGEIARVIEAVNANLDPARVVAIDLPSGLDPDSGERAGAAIVAGLTVTLALPKVGLRMPAARAHVGELVLADIGIPAEAYAPYGIDAREVFRGGELVRVVEAA